MSDGSCYVGCDTVVTTTTEAPEVLPTTASTAVVVRPAQAERGLAMTGSDVVGLGVFGTCAIVIGAVMVRWRKRRV